MLVACGLAIAPGVPAMAWGPAGHIIVGDIAMSYVCESARLQIDELLEGKRLGGASRWPDWIRDDPEWAHTRPWHYINVADGERIEAALGGPEGNVIEAAERFAGELADRGLEARRRAEALKFLAHFIADIHQPLHVGRAADRGGNRIEVVFDGERTNLHRFWDAQALLARGGTGLRENVERVAVLAREGDADWRGGSVVDWARESQAFRDVVYHYRRPWFGGPPVLSQAYVGEAGSVVRLRLAQAGVRLAERLNQILCNEG